VTHPFHPWRGREFELVDYRRCWNDWWVFYHTDDMQLAHFPASWTDLADADPFVELSQGRAVARVADLLRLVDLIQDLEAKPVKGIKPNV